MSQPDQRSQDDERAVYIISVAAELAGVHPQTLRIYERKGLVRPQRTSGTPRPTASDCEPSSSSPSRE